jgi:hypothetical protein
MTQQFRSFLEKNAWNLVSTTIPLCVGLGMMYSGIISRIDKNQALNEQTNRYQDMQIQEVKQSVDKNSNNIEHMKDYIITGKGIKQ